MQEWNIESLRCTRCKRKLFVKEHSKNFSILACKCREYPLVEGILYLYKDSLRKKALRFLKKGKYKEAVSVLIDQKRRLSFPISFLFNHNLINWLAQIIFGKRMFDLIGFKRVVEMLAAFSFPKPWVSYIKNREKMPAFWMSYYAANLLIKNSQKVLDLGCGTGQFLRVLGRKTNPKNVYGLDISFLSLFFARRYFTSPKTLLICADIEKGLPFVSESLDLVLSSDSFHYLKDKQLTLKEVVRVMKESGIFAALHIVNSTRVVFGNVRGVAPKRLFTMLNRVGLKHNFLFSDTLVWMSLGDNLPLILKKPQTLSTLKNAFAFGFFASKRALPESVKPSPKEQVRFRRTQKDFFLDKELLYDTNLHFLFVKFESFLFLSPHLDDAVLSCGFLLEKLVKGGKEVKVLTLFSKASGGPLTKQAEEFVKRSGFKDPEMLFETRAKEDAKALAYLGVRFKHLKYVDATFRRTRFLNFINLYNYPNSEKQFSGRASFFDCSLASRLETELRRIIKNFPKETLILAPLGIGGHADHVIVREVAVALARELGYSVIFWEDFPYNVNPQALADFFSTSEHPSEYIKLEPGSLSGPKKYKAIRFYKSQMNVLFPDGKIPKMKERYFLSKELIKNRNLFAANSGE